MAQSKLDLLILGLTEGDEKVLSYLESLSPTQVEDIFRPMFSVTRPTREFKAESNTKPVPRKPTAKDFNDSKLAKLDPVKLKFLQENGLI